MKILSVEGLKGTGKSTIVSRLKEEFGLRSLEKFTKGKSDLPSFLYDFRKEYKDSFQNVDSSLALNFYANFFNRLEETDECGEAIIERGLLSLPCSSLYGYFMSDEEISFREYITIVLSLYTLAIEQYKRLECDTSFLVIECGRDIILDRIEKRKIKKPSDRLFLDKFELYNNLQKESEDICIANLPYARFFRLRNDLLCDLENIIVTASGII